MFGLWLVIRYLRGTDTEAVVECRHCGAAVGRDAERCSTCGHDGIAIYEIK